MKKTLIFHGGCFALIFAIAVTSCTKNTNSLPQNEEQSKLAPTLKTASIDPTAAHIPLPSAVSASYSTSLNTTVSDDFNDSTVDLTKWQYRTDGTAKWGTTTSYIYTAGTGSDHFLVLKGSDADSKGSGVSAKSTVKYGFYMVRWQAIGWSGITANGWHPAIWGAGCDFSGTANSGKGNCIPEAAANDRFLEADFMEGFESNNPYWESHLLLWDAGTVYQNINMKPTTTTWPNTTSSWITMGYEYTPSYMAIWQYSSGTWTKLKQVTVSTAGSSATNVNTAYRTPLYWVFSNLYKDATRITADSWLHIDYFYLYNYTGS